MKKSVWKNKKNKKLASRSYEGHYGRVKKERVFTLTAHLKNGAEHTVAFESHEAAKAAGWTKAL